MIGQLPPGSAVVLGILAIVFVFLVVWLWFATDALVAFVALLVFAGLVLAVAKLRRPPEVE